MTHQCLARVFASSVTDWHMMAANGPTGLWGSHCIVVGDFNSYLFDFVADCPVCKHAAGMGNG